MDDADERDKDKKKGGFTWINDISEASQYACETAQHLTGYWSDFADSCSEYMANGEPDEPRDVENGEPYEPIDKDLIIQQISLVGETVSRNEDSIKGLHKKIEEAAARARSSGRRSGSQTPPW